MPHTVEKDFTFTFATKENTCTLNVPVILPLKTTAREFAYRLINAHRLPCFVSNDLNDKFEGFVKRETSLLHDKNADDAVKRVKSGEVNVDDLINQWLPKYNKELKIYSKPHELSRDEKFAEVYHTLIHSPALETLLNLEHEYSLGIERLIKERNKDLQHLQEKQRLEMDQALNTTGSMYRDEDINSLAQRFFENRQVTENTACVTKGKVAYLLDNYVTLPSAVTYSVRLTLRGGFTLLDEALSQASDQPAVIENKWQTELNALHEQQKNEYREWVFRVHEDSQGNVSLPSYVQRLRSLSTTLPEAEEDERQAPVFRLEESFTIHLGAQMKTTHNLRILCTNILDLCRHKPHTIGGVVIPQPQRLQTAMSLYSNSLCGMILLVDNRLNTYTGIKQKFAGVCELSTDFHFPTLNAQLAAIEQELPNINEVRTMKRIANDDDDKISLHSSSSSSGSNEEKDKPGERRLHSGDFYITKHSNLSEVHIVFNLVSDDNLRTSDITSRHPVILSIRNIIKLCFRYDVHTITIPLLLTHEMTEEMTIPWCMKRAELMFKCVKGFMIEMATYSSQQSKTIQFLLPMGLSEDLFHHISNMIPSIFRLSNPLVVKSS